MSAIIDTSEGVVRIDPEAVEPGTYISPSDLEDALGFKRETKEFAFALLNMARDLEDALAAAGNALMVRSEAYGLRVMTPEESVDYGDQWFWRSLHHARRVHRRVGRVLTTATLRDTDRQEADRRASVRAMVLRAQQQCLKDNAALAKLAAAPKGD